MGVLRGEEFAATLQQAFEFLWKMLLAYLQHSLLTFVSVALGDVNLLMELAQYIYFSLGDNACQ